MWRVEFEAAAIEDLARLEAYEINLVKDLFAGLIHTANPRIVGGLNGKFWCYGLGIKIIRCRIHDDIKTIHVVAISL